MTNYAALINYLFLWMSNRNMLPSWSETAILSPHGLNAHLVNLPEGTVRDTSKTQLDRGNKLVRL